MATKVLILAGDTHGDLAIVAATCDQIRAIDPDSENCKLSSNPARIGSLELRSYFADALSKAWRKHLFLQTVYFLGIGAK